MRKRSCAIITLSLYETQENESNMNAHISKGSNKVCFNNTIKNEHLFRESNHEQNGYRYNRCTGYRSYFRYG
ncbi:hypothetical protein VA249_33830 [Vibrio alfacsensis]|nr:hypothetical protein VA249_33830 [Vibrio alfacsensis]